MTKGALSDITVLEYASFISGPYCTKMMADQGASIIKIEEPGTGDSSRRFGPFPHNTPDPEASGLFLYLNTNKSSITLNLNSETGLNLFKELVKRCDIFVENHHPRTIKALGIDYPRLKKVNPALIYTSITPFGLTGPHEDFQGNNLISFNMGGMASFTPDWVDDREKMPPLQPGGHQADFAAGLAGALASLGALYGRENHGKGCLVDVSEQEAVAFALARSTAFYTYVGVRHDRKKEARSMESPVPCKDGYVEFHCVEDAHWQAFRQVIGNPKWSASPLFKTYATRCKNWKRLEEKLIQWTMQHTKQEIYHLMQSKRVAFGPMNTAEDVLRSPHINHRNYFIEIEHPRAGKLTHPGAPFKLTATPHQPRNPAPLLGQHNEKIYGEMLGISKKEINRLKKEGIL